MANNHRPGAGDGPKLVLCDLYKITLCGHDPAQFFVSNIPVDGCQSMAVD